MCELSWGLLHQNKFPVKFVGPNLFFLCVLVLVRKERTDWDLDTSA